MIIEKRQIQTNEELFLHAYKVTFPKVSSFVKKMGCTFEEAKDIFQDALVIYYEKNKQQDFQQDHSTSHYVKGIARHLWYKKYRETKSNRSLSIFPDLKVEEEKPKISENILRFVEISGKKCLELLKSFYYEKLNMKDIAGKFGFSGERSQLRKNINILRKCAIHLKLNP